ncbi:hypothetical protein Droror1_Dr00019303 [Drosera rotundifolia]
MRTNGGDGRPARTSPPRRASSTTPPPWSASYNPSPSPSSSSPPHRVGVDWLEFKRVRDPRFGFYPNLNAASSLVLLPFYNLSTRDLTWWLDLVHFTLRSPSHFLHAGSCSLRAIFACGI